MSFAQEKVPGNPGPGDGVRPEIIKQHLKQLTGIRHHQSAPASLEEAADYIRERFSAFGLEASEQRFQALGHQNRNIIGQIEGSRPQSPVLILGAHYDTVSRSPGADDNASGLAVLLEAARVLAAHPSETPILFIAFAQEEQGCLGSRFFVNEWLKSDRPLGGMISLECVGFARDEPGSQRIIPHLPVHVPDRGNFLGLVANPEGRGLIRGMETAIKAMGDESGKDTGKVLPFVSLQVPGNGQDFPDTRRSDHAPFWDAGLPALMLTDTADFRNPNYHQPGDRIETLNQAFIQKVAGALIGFLKKSL